MRRINKYLLLSVLFLFCNCTTKNQPPLNSISKFGEYKGYSEEKYDSWKRTSQYIEMKDGIKLAMDIIRPAKEGQIESKPLPVIWELQRYHRSEVKDGEILSMVDRATSLQKMIKHGYIVVVVDTRGSGASYGFDSGPHSNEEIQDAYDITEWLTEQSWCDGNIGMYGYSHGAIINFLTLSKNPPHLKAVFPTMGAFDIYDLIYPNGINHKWLIQGLSEYLPIIDLKQLAPPVDEDSTRSMLAEAIEDHKKNVSSAEVIEKLAYRDNYDELLGLWREGNPVYFLQSI